MVLTGLTKYREEGLLILRIGIGLAFIAHGWPKIAGGTAAWEGLGTMVGLPVPVVFGFIAALIELLGGVLIILGLLFRPAVILLTLQMIAALVYHFRAGDTFDEYNNALKMAIVFLALIFIGPGRYSIDKR